MAGLGWIGMGLGPGRGLMSQRLFRSPLSPFPDWPADHVEDVWITDANQINSQHPSLTEN